MLFFGGALGVLGFFLWVFCIIDVITTPPHQVRNLPKLLWLLIVILLFDLGSLAWLVAGRHWGPKDGPGLRERLGAIQRGERPFTTKPSMPVRRGPRRPSNPDDDEEFLAGLDARVKEQRRRAREEQPDDPSTPPAS